MYDAFFSRCDYKHDTRENIITYSYKRVSLSLFPNVYEYNLLYKLIWI